MSSINNATEHIRATSRIVGSNRVTIRMAASISRPTREMAVVCNNAINKTAEIRNNNSGAAHISNNSSADLYNNKTADTTLSSRIFSSSNKGGIIIKTNGDM